MELKSNELRSGNLIIGFYETEEDNDLHETICEFKFYDCYNNFYWVESKDKITDFSGFKPIPLTEEWMLKFGFFIVEANGTFEATLPNLRYSVQTAKDYNGFFFCDGETVLTNFNYLHQLQNLFFALTGEELKLIH